VGNRGVYLRVGLLLLFGAGAGVAMVLLLGRSTIRHGVYYEAYFHESVQGLVIGAPVKFRGVSIGQITDIGLVTAAYSRDTTSAIDSAAFRDVLVRFVIDPNRLGKVPGTEEAVRLGLRVRLASQGLTGVAYLELDFVDPERYPPMPVPWTPLYPYIPSMPSTITQVQDAAESLLSQIQHVDLQRLANATELVLNDLHAQLGDHGEVRQTLAATTALLDSTRTALDQSDLPRLVADLRATSAAVRELAEGRQTRQLLASTTRTLDELGEAAKRLPALIAAFEAVARRASNSTADLQADLTPVLRDARAAVSNLRETTETLRRNPASVLLGAPPPRQPAR
jgi:paraquat-inducible protein B